MILSSAYLWHSFSWLCLLIADNCNQPHKLHSKCPLLHHPLYFQNIPSNPPTPTVLQPTNSDSPLNLTFFSLYINVFEFFFFLPSLKSIEITAISSFYTAITLLKFSDFITAPGTTPPYLNTIFCLFFTAPTQRKWAEEKHYHPVWFHFKFITSPLKWT